jgi:TPR repeat protein
VKERLKLGVSGFSRSSKESNEIPKMKFAHRLILSPFVAFTLTYSLAGCGERSAASKPLATAVVQPQEISLEEYLARLQKEAEAGNAEAQFNLGRIYLRGEGSTGVAFVRDVPKNIPKAVEWFQKAAMQGNINAQRDLGMLFKLGVGVEEDAKSAFMWLQRAAVQGNDVAQYNLGLMYADGAGVKLDLSRASAWLTLAAAQGNEKAKMRYMAIDAKLTSAQRAEGQKLAAGWKKGESI